MARVGSQILKHNRVSVASCFPALPPVWHELKDRPHGLTALAFGGQRTQELGGTSTHTYDPGVQLFVQQFLGLGEVTECDFGSVFTLAD